jgi:hypothetical protein
MSGYTHTTRDCPVNQLHSELSQAVRDYFQIHLLGDPGLETIRCCETIIQRQDSGRLVTLLEGSGDTTSHLAILLTPELLIWARSGDRSDTIVNGILLKSIKVKTYGTKRSNNMQLDITGLLAYSKEYVRGTLQLGPEPAAQSFCEEVMRVVQKETPPVKRKFSRWFGGS